MRRSTILVLSLLVLLTLPIVTYAETEVGGILSSDTTWTADHSPYIVTETVQIPHEVKLTIKPGVTVKGSRSFDMFKLNGEIYAHGFANKTITLEKFASLFEIGVASSY